MFTTRIGFKKIGDWRAVEQAFSELGPNIKRASRRGQNKAADTLLKIVLGHLDRQDLPWVPLKPQTMLNKGNDLILLDTYKYRFNIKKWTDNDGKVLVGVKKGVVYKKKNKTIEVSKVAAMHEFGFGRVPKRPLWEPSLRELGGPEGIRNIVAQTLAKAINNQIKNRNAPLRVSAGSLLKYVR
jgi:hypothetical protein